MEYAVLKLTCPEEFRDIFAAELGEAGFDMLLETEEGVEGYIDSELKHTIDLSGIDSRYALTGDWAYSWGVIQNQNWNEEWEKNYEPIIVDDKCLIRADFHQVTGDFLYVLNITPKMSFGTGHHATTYLMVSTMMKADFKGSTVLDAGCGTGILAILAEKLGAGSVDAYDVSSLCTENTSENIEANGCRNIRVQEGTIEEVSLKAPYDFILANINKNVLMEEVFSYEKYLQKNGRIMLSGFFEKDIVDLEARAKEAGLVIVSRQVKDDWAALVLLRSK